MTIAPERTEEYPETEPIEVDPDPEPATDFIPAVAEIPAGVLYTSMPDVESWEELQVRAQEIAFQMHAEIYRMYLDEGGPCFCSPPRGALLAGRPQRHANLMGTVLVVVACSAVITLCALVTLSILLG